MSDLKRTLLENIMSHAFELEQYGRFIKQLFNEIQIKSTRKSNAIWKEFHEQIASFIELAGYKDEEGNKIAILAVELKRGVTVQRARSMQRNFVARFLDHNEYDAALVAFYSEGEGEWRLSFVQLDYTFTKEGILEKITPAKRYSYLVGEGEPNHTVKERIFPLFINDEQNPTLSKLEEAFSVEVVTKDFFNQYREKYLEIKEYLDENEAFLQEAARCSFTTEEFAKKLMGQLAFLYFLQKKGWLGIKMLPKKLSEDEFFDICSRQTGQAQDVMERVYYSFGNTRKLAPDELRSLTEKEAIRLAECFKGTIYEGKWGRDGERKFIRRLFENSQKNNRNFFDEYLSPLFYEALNNDRGDTSYFNKLNCKIPFLNGGLFEPLDGYDWKNVSFSIPNNLFSNQTETEHGTGILDVFDRYNFTMNEDEPLEKEVAVDPEMLGKIFENLLDVKDRKSKGAFYTPREIVHYMCQESLVNYLTNKTGLDREELALFIRYGEFMKDEDNQSGVDYKKVYSYKLPEPLFNNIEKIDEALKNVKVADPAVGSGAFPLGMLNEIVKARMNITDYLIKKEKDKSRHNRIRFERSPYLLKKNTMQHNIFAVDIESSAIDITKLRLWLSLIVDEYVSSAPRPLPNLDYNIMGGNSLVDEFEGFQLFDESMLYHSASQEEVAVKVKQSELFAPNSTEITIESDMLENLYEWQQKLFNEQIPDRKREIKKEVEKLEWELIEYKVTIDGNQSTLSQLRRHQKQKVKPYFLWKLEFAKIFRENNGFDIVIGNPPYGAKFNKKEKEVYQRIFKHQDYQLDSYLLFTEKAFEIAREDATISYIIPNTWLTNLKFKKIRLFLVNKNTVLNVTHYSEKVFNAVVDTQVAMFQKSISTNNSVSINIYESEDKQERYVAFQDRWKKLNGEPINIFTNEKQETLLEKLKEKSLPFNCVCKVIVGMKPYQKGKGRPPQTEETVKQRIFDSPSQIDSTYRPLLRGRDIEKYLIKWNSDRWIKYGEWLAEPRISANFDADEKIVIRQTGDSLIATLDSQKFICMNNMHVIHSINPSYSLKYILALLNSKLLNFYFQFLNPEQGEALAEVKKENVEKLIVLEADENLQQEFITLVDKIMNKRENGLDTQDLETEIDNKIYSSYDLNDEEIAIIEKGF